MRRYSVTFILGCLALMFSGCSLPAVQALHAPFHPAATEMVTLTAEAQAPDGIAEISIVRRSFEFSGECAAWVGGACVPLKALVENVVQTCSIEGNPTTARCEVNVGPFRDGTFITYGARVRDAQGKTAQDQWIGFAVGQQTNANEPIPVYTRADSADAIDVVLIPVDYNGTPGRTFRDFVTAARAFVANGYLAHTQVTSDRRNWNFYVNPVTGGLLQTPTGRSVTQPLNWSNISTLADTVAYVHNNGTWWRDFANFGTPGHFTINSGAVGTIMHETGHALFGLSDEYCCDGGTVDVAWPHANIFQTQADCQSSATSHGVATTACTQLSSTVGFCGGGTAANPALGPTNQLWRQDADSDLMGCGGTTGAAGGQLDGERIDWFYQQL